MNVMEKEDDVAKVCYEEATARESSALTAVYYNLCDIVAHL